MDSAKKEIRAACKKAADYRAWRNPLGVWFVTLFDADSNAFFEFQYTDHFSKRDKMWVASQFEMINKKKSK